jgi:hypothetical protein
MLECGCNAWLFAMTAGERLVESLSQPGDPFSLTLLIEEAGHVKDFIDRLRPVLDGDRRAWLELRIGAKTVEVVVTNTLVQYRQLTEQLRRLLAEVHRQRGASGAGDGGDDPTNV